MKSLIRRCAIKAGAVLVLAVSLSATQAQLLWTLSDQNSSASINLGDPSHPLGMYQWLVNGQNQLSQQWFWYRIDPGNNIGLNNLGLVSANKPSANQLNSLFSNGQVSVGVNYTLTGSDPAGVPLIQEGISVRNLSAAPVTFHLIQYSDFDLGGSLLSDSVSIVPFGGKYAGAEQVKSTITLNEQIIADASVSRYADRAEAGTFPELLAKITSGAYNLDPSTLSASGDAVWALQWDMTLDPGQIVNFSKQKTIQGVPVPEPAALVLAMVALATLWRRQRN